MFSQLLIIELIIINAVKFYENLAKIAEVVRVTNKWRDGDIWLSDENKFICHILNMFIMRMNIWENLTKL